MELDCEHTLQIINDELVLSVPHLNVKLYMTEDGTVEQEIEEEEIDQYGGGVGGYTIETIAQRNIPKFKVQGFEYRVTIAEMTNLNYREAVQLLHHTLDRKYFFYYGTLYFFP